MFPKQDGKFALKASRSGHTIKLHNIIANCFIYKRNILGATPSQILNLKAKSLFLCPSLNFIRIINKWFSKKIALIIGFISSKTHSNKELAKFANSS